MKKNKWNKLMLLGTVLISSFSLAFQSTAIHASRLYKANTSMQKILREEKAGNQEHTKSEVVYAALDEDGQVKNMYIVNRFESEDGQEIVDFGDYSSVQSMSLHGEVEQAFEGYKVKPGEKSFFYEGILKEQQLPWEINIEYSLNGSTQKASELVNQSGALDIQFTVKKNAEFQKDGIDGNPWADQYMLQVSVTLPNEVATQVEVEGGQLNVAGSDHLISFVYLPNQEKGVCTVSAKVENFHMPSIQFAASPFAMDMGNIKEDLPDFSENEDLITLKDGTKQLSDGSSSLSEGLHTLSEASTKLQTALNELSTGGTEIREGGPSIREGIDSLSTGLTELSENGSTLVKASNTSADGAKALSTGIDTFAEGLTGYINGVNSFTNNLQELPEGVSTLNDGATGLLSAANKFASGLNQLSTKGTELVTASKTINDEITSMALKLQGMPSETELAELKTQLAGLDQRLTDLVTASSSFKTAFTEINSSLTGLSTLANSISQGLAGVETGLQGIIQSQDRQTIVDQLSADAESNADVQTLLAIIGEQQTSLQTIAGTLHALYVTDNPQQPAPFSMLTSGLQAIVNETAATSELVQGYNTFHSGIENLAYNLGQLKTLTGMFDFLSSMGELSQFSAFHTGVEEYVAGVQAMNLAFENTDQTPRKDLLFGIESLVGGLKTLNTSLASMDGEESALVQLEQAGSQLITGSKELSTGASDLASGLQEFTTGIDSYTSGVSEVTTGYTTFADGLTKYSKGVDEYTSGVNQLASGYDEFHSGIQSSVDGAGKLADGAKALHKGTSTMDQQMEEMMDELLADYQSNELEAVPSFASNKNKNVDLVQFVFMTEAIEGVDQVEDDVIDDKKKSFWDRIKELFS